MGDKDKLSPALEAELRFLRRQVDFGQQQYIITICRRAAAKQRYHYAMDDLTKFVSNRRKEGYKI
jgi:hypothetical protein